jgi:hypothetical protein
MEFFLFATASRSVLRPTQPLILCVPGAISLEVKQQAHKAHRFFSSSAEVKNVWSCTYIELIRRHSIVLS